MSEWKHRQRGFTLIELLTAVVVLSVLLMVAAPGLQSMLASQRARGAAHDLISDLVLARSEAVKRNKDVVIDPIEGWSGGWSVKMVASAEVISTRKSLGQGISMTRAPAGVTYDGSGRISGALAAVRFELFDGNTTYRCITVDPSGLPSTQTEACP